MCPHEAHKPDQSLCPNARLRPVANQCCDEWICDTPEGGPKVLANSALWSATGVTGVGGGNVDRDSMLQMYSGVDSLSLNAVADEYYEEESITDIDQELFNQLRVAERRNEKFWIENEFPGRNTMFFLPSWTAVFRKKYCLNTVNGNRILLQLKVI